MLKIYPSLISSDLLNLQTTIDTLSHASAGWHIDIMDNHFVPNLTWGAQFANAIAAYSSKPVWAHLMIDPPYLFIPRLNLASGSTVTFHIETSDDIHQLIDVIRSKEWHVGIAINPKTPIQELFPYLGSVDQILCMSVNPGHSGQQFIPETVERIATLATIIKREEYHATVACDGGINRTTIKAVADAGATEFGIAHGIFATADPAAEVAYLSSLDEKECI